jgi:nucleotide-binding universal stress UspA family protein
MAFKDLLLVLRSFPTPTPEGTILRCVDLAAAWGARLSTISFGIVPKAAANPLRHVLVDISAVVAAESNTSAADARRLLAMFGSAAQQRNVPGEAILEMCELAKVPRVLVEHARLRDLTIMAVPPDDYLASYDLNLFAESMVFDSGHPALVLPGASTDRERLAFDRLVVAWDGSRPAARAVADALPLLRAAEAVRILTVANKKTAAAVRSAPDLAEHLATHGITAVVDSVTSAGRAIGTVFADYVSEHAIDLIVMGAYGHSRLRDFILGGATRSLLAAPPTALLLSN